MKKYLLLLILSIFFITPVKADTIIDIQYGGSNYSEYYYLNNLPYTSWYDYNDTSVDYSHSCNSRLDCYSQAINYFSTTNYQYYSIFLQIYPNSNHIDLCIIPFNFSTTYEQIVYASDSNINRFRFESNNSIISLVLEGFSDPASNNFYMLYDSNFTFTNSGDYIFNGFYDNENNDYNNMLQVHNNEPMPKIKDLLEYSSWSDYYQNNLTGYTEVNLDNYEYVILSLKDYSQTNAFQTNLQLKGQIGITPVYNFGQTSKDAITGVQVQDRCNLSYENYTSYPFYILQSDLQNNAVYYVKSCSSGSSFKFDSNIFDITYITQSNLDNPTVTINGQTYNTIPYVDLPSSATGNESNNYIPGQSGSATDTGGLDSAIKNVQQKMSEIWNTFTYFTDFINQIFNVFPDEVKTILLSAFTIMIIIGLIKRFIN